MRFWFFNFENDSIKKAKGSDSGEAESSFSVHSSQIDVAGEGPAPLDPKTDSSYIWRGFAKTSETELADNLVR